ncbi:MAG: heavy metal-associated domain-containing protein [Crocinitomicaceae bacterium]
MNKVYAIFALLVLFMGVKSFAQSEPKSKTQTVKFKTSAVCGECKERIEDKLNYTKGIVYAELDLDTKVLEVKFKTKTLNAEKIKYAVSLLGYDAGETPRNEKAFNELPKCCRSEGFCKRP